MGSFSLAHWLIVAVVVLLIFGPNKLGAVGKGLGEGIRNFKKGLSGEDDKLEGQTGSGEADRNALSAHREKPS